MMKRFIKQFIGFQLFLAVPITLLLILYVYFDPFKVIYSYSDYSFPYVISNRDYISTEVFMKNISKYKYDSFIFGSSRTLAYRPSEWSKYLDEKAKPFMFDASGESIYGIYTKLKYLDLADVKINNALIIIDNDCSFSQSENHKGHLFIKHPITSKESNLDFHIQFIKAYFSPNFILKYYSYLILKEYKPFMVGIIENRKIAFDTITNEIHIIDQETEISQKPTEYYLKRINIFYERKGEQIDSMQRINSKQLIMLNEIKRILQKNNTNYKVVISPLYNQTKFSNPDMSILKNIFDKNLFDFSGKNKYTNSKTNYYETSHYRPVVGDSILNIIYNKYALR